MRIVSYISFVIIFLFLLSVNAQTKRRCGTTELYKQRLGEEGYRRFIEHTQRWIEDGIRDLKRRRGSDSVRIAVVVHVIHSGQTIGEGANISAAQVRSQIQVLNEDFKRLNADTVNTPNIFKSVASCINVHFELATIDPNGNRLEEPGINRVQGNNFYDIQTFDREVKPATIWDPEKYMNIWSVVIGGNDEGILGYATFPTNSTLSGFTAEDTFPPNQDGVVIDVRYFGSNYTGNNFIDDTLFDRGRTATHEIGHYLGLFHIWGDGNCDLDDFVDDTPLADGSNQDYQACNDLSPNSCNRGQGDLPDMFQNYMDYTADICMNLFTQGQKTRMRATLEKADRRKNFDSNFESVTGIYSNNRRPTDITLSSNTIAENTPVPTLIGTFTTIDPDNNDRHTYDVSDTNNFKISQDSLYSNVDFDFETTNSYTITITTTDNSNLSFSKSFIIFVTDVDDVSALPENTFKDNKIVLYPNPFTNSIKIKGLEDIKDVGIKFINIAGQVVKEYNRSQNSYDISNLPSGTYIAVIEFNGKREIIKFLVQSH